VKRVHDFIAALVCPYCLVVDEKGFVVMHNRRPTYRRFKALNAFVRHIRVRHPDSYTAETLTTLRGTP